MEVRYDILGNTKHFVVRKIPNNSIIHGKGKKNNKKLVINHGNKTKYFPSE
jgi:hypothetical protein